MESDRQGVKKWWWWCVDWNGGGGEGSKPCLACKVNAQEYQQVVLRSCFASPRGHAACLYHWGHLWLGAPTHTWALRASLPRG